MEDNNYLSSMIGRVVQIYRGGPDSNNGWLLDVNEDYLTLQKDDGEIIYYKTAHIKSIREDNMIKYNSLLSIDAKSPILKAPTFNELATNLMEQTVSINGKGPESKEGQLIDVKEDYMTLYTEEDGFVFFNEQHIKSLSFPTEKEDEKEDGKEDGKEEKTKEVAKEEESSMEEINNGLDALKEVYGHIFADNMHGVLTNLKYSWIKINRKGPESLEGMLVDSNDNHLVIVVDNEILRVSTFHVKNFSIKNEIVKDESSEKESNEKDSKEKNSKEKDSNKQESKSTNNNQKNEKQDKKSDKNQGKDKQPFTQQEINRIIRKRKRRYQNRIQQQGKKGK